MTTTPSAYSHFDTLNDLSQEQKHKPSLLPDEAIQHEMDQLSSLARDRFGKEKVVQGEIGRERLAHTDIDKELSGALETTYPAGTEIEVNGTALQVTEYRQDTPKFPIDTTKPITGERPCIVLEDGFLEVAVAVDYFEQLHVMGKIKHLKGQSA